MSRRGDSCAAGREEKPVEVLLQLVDVPPGNYGRVEDSVASMHHVVVYWDRHERLVRRDASQHAGVERLEVALRI